MLISLLHSQDLHLLIYTDSTFQVDLLEHQEKQWLLRQRNKGILEILIDQRNKQNPTENNISDCCAKNKFILEKEVEVVSLILATNPLLVCEWK